MVSPGRRRPWDTNSNDSDSSFQSVEELSKEQVQSKTQLRLLITDF